QRQAFCRRSKDRRRPRSRGDDARYRRVAQSARRGRVVGPPNGGRPEGRRTRSIREERRAVAGTPGTPGTPYTAFPVSRTYVRVVVLETAIIVMLVIFGRLFS